MVWAVAAAGFFIGILVFGLIFLYLIGNWYIGDLREDRSGGEEKPYYFMEIANGASGHLRKNRFVILRVKRENYIQNQ